MGTAVTDVVVTGSRRGHAARHRRARAATSAGPPGECGIEDGEGRCREFDPPTTSRSRTRAAPTASRSSRSSPRTRRWPTPAGTAELPYDADRIGSIIGTGIGGLGTIEANDLLLEQRPEGGLAARGAADDGQRRRGRGVDAPRPARPRLRRRVGLLVRRRRDRHGGAHDPAPATPSRSSPAAPRRR